MNFKELGKKKLSTVSEAISQTPDEFLGSWIKKYFKGYEKDALRILVTSAVTCLLCYFYHMIYAYGCPDALSEGVYYYRNTEWAAKLARWMVKYINLVIGRNVVIPVIIFPVYCLLIGYACFLLCRMFNIRQVLSQVLLTAVMVSFPVVLHHFCYPYIAVSYAFAFLMAVVGTKLIWEHKIAGFILGIIAFLMMLGTYQTYIGAVSALAFIALVYDMLTKEKILKSLFSLLKVGLAGIVAGLIDIPFSGFMARLTGVGLISRVDVSFDSIIENFGFSRHFAYAWFFSFFTSDDFLSRNKIYPLLLIVLAIIIIAVAVNLIIAKKIGQAAVLIVSVLFLPAAMNIFLFIFPSEGIRDIMRYQYVLGFVLIFFLLEQESKRIYNILLRYVTYICLAVLVAGNVITANSTAFLHKIMYEYTVKQGEIMVSRLYELDEYERNETPVIMTGPVDVSHLIARYPMIFKYAESEGGPVFWGGYVGMGSSRYHFFYDYLGMDFKEYPESEYIRITDSEEFKEMPVWPKEGSVAMIDGYAVIKMGEEPVR